MITLLFIILKIVGINHLSLWFILFALLIDGLISENNGLTHSNGNDHN